MGHTLWYQELLSVNETKHLANAHKPIKAQCILRITHFQYIMIKSFKHKGLELFFTEGKTKLIQSQHVSRIELRLQALHTAFNIEDMNIPGWNLHKLKGDRKDLWSVKVTGNWRITFEFEDGHAYIVNYEDYH